MKAEVGRRVFVGSIIFAGVVLTRQPLSARSMTRLAPDAWRERDAASRPGRLIPLSSRSRAQQPDNTEANEGVRFVAERILSLNDGEVAETCRRWSATPIDGDAMSRLQARQVWALRLAIPEPAWARFDALPIGVQAQLAEIYAEVWSAGVPDVRSERRA